MDNKSSRGQLSLSSTNLTTPAAESTCINGSSSQAKFNWGEGTISPRSRNNSLTTIKNASMTGNVNGTPPKVAILPISRIDPRTYVDIHSNGLASRIVKYHNNSARFNRSLSMGNLYNKPGQFPVVHLKKNEQQYKAKKCRNLSMTRIAAPEKSVFHGNTLSSILRSGSIVGFQKSDEEISRENRPILHPPPTENEMAPTRSVLEVLKEISRKRINSDELDSTDIIKKHCKEPEFDTFTYNGHKSLSKRQREMSTSAAYNSQISPEQQAVKKRMCNYNNDIMSSLSSSMLSNNKTKMLEMQSQKRTASYLANTNETLRADIETSYSRNEKERCTDTLEHFSQPIKSYTLLASRPPVSAAELDKYKIGKVARSTSEPFVRQTKPKLTLFNRDYDEDPIELRNDISESREDGDLCGIQFVKPKKSSSLSSDGTLLLEKTKKSKLALMLKGLKGELDEEDEVDTLPKAQPEKEIEASVAVTPAPSVPTTQSAINTGILTTKATTVTSTPDAANKPVTEAAAIAPAAVKAELQFNPPVSTPLVSSSAPNGIQAVATTVGASTSLTVPVLSTSSDPASIGGFSFGLNKPMSLSATTTAAASTLPSTIQTKVATKTPSTSSLTAILPPASQPKIAGIKSFALVSSPTEATPASSAPSFSFGQITSSLSAPAAPISSFGSAAISTANANKASSQAPTFGQTASNAQPTFSFGSLAASSSSSSVTHTTSTISAPTFNFGGIKSSFSPAGTPTKLVLSGSSFNSATSSNPQPTTTAMITGSFSFSDSFGTSTEVPKPIFNNMIPTTTTTSSNATFAFSATKPASATQTNTASTFTFGSPTVTTASAQPSMFGSTTPVKPSNSFTFGPPAHANPSNGSFSFSSTTDKPVTPANTTVPSIGGFSFNASASTNNLPSSEPNKTMFASPDAAAAPSKSVFSFGSTSNNLSVAKPPMFGASTANPTNMFGAPATTPAQGSTFAFGTSSSTSTHQGVASTSPSTSLFGAANAPNSLGGSSSSTGSLFGQPSAAVAPLQQSNTFTFGSSSSSSTTELNKPTGGFVFGSSSSIGSNASKPATDMNKTFVFQDGNTTITPAPPGTTSLFGGGNTTNNGNNGATKSKVFSFGGAGNGSAGSNTFGGSRQTVNQSPVFNFGAAAPAAPQNGNLFAPQQQPIVAAPSPNMMETVRPIRKAMRRLHKT